MKKGIDVSHHNGIVNWGKVAGAGISFAYAKASEGLGMVDNTLEKNIRGAVGAHLRVGAYHFLRPEADASAQAQHFLDSIKNVRAMLTLPPVVDVEFAAIRGQSGDAWSPLPRQTRVDKVRHYLDAVEAELGVKPMVYCSPGWWDGFFGNADFSDYPLWVANYNVAKPQVPASWKGWTAWQSGEHGTVSGAGVGTVDVDVWNGDLPHA